MPRWPKTPADYDVAIERINNQIAKYTSLLEDAQARLNELITQKRDTELQELYEYMLSAGISPAEAVSKLKSDCKSDT